MLHSLHSLLLISLLGAPPALDPAALEPVSGTTQGASPPEELVLEASEGEGRIRLGFEGGEPGVWLYDSRGELAAALEVRQVSMGTEVRLGLFAPGTADGEIPLLGLEVFREDRPHHGSRASLDFLGGGPDGKDPVIRLSHPGGQMMQFGPMLSVTGPTGGSAFIVGPAGDATGNMLVQYHAVDEEDGTLGGHKPRGQDDLGLLLRLGPHATGESHLIGWRRGETGAFGVWPRGAASSITVPLLLGLNLATLLSLVALVARRRAGH